MLRALKVAAVKDELRAYAVSEWSLFAQGSGPPSIGAIVPTEIQQRPA